MKFLLLCQMTRRSWSVWRYLGSISFASMGSRVKLQSGEADQKSSALHSLLLCSVKRYNIITVKILIFWRRWIFGEIAWNQTLKNHRIHRGHREKQQLSVLSVCSVVDIPFIDSSSEWAGASLFLWKGRWGSLWRGSSGIVEGGSKFKKADELQDEYNYFWGHRLLKFKTADERGWTQIYRDGEHGWRGFDGFSRIRNPCVSASSAQSVFHYRRRTIITL